MRTAILGTLAVALSVAVAIAVVVTTIGLPIVALIVASDPTLR